MSLIATLTQGDVLVSVVVRQEQPLSAAITHCRVHIYAVRTQNRIGYHRAGIRRDSFAAALADIKMIVHNAVLLLVFVC